jgi:hypothetical protein
MSGFKFAPRPRGRHPADPAMFITAVPDWRAGDEFLAGAELQKFRILEILPEWDEDAAFQAVWVVEPIEA